MSGVRQIWTKISVGQSDCYQVTAIATFLGRAGRSVRCMMMNLLGQALVAAVQGIT